MVVEQLALIAAINFLAAFTQASCGFGYGLIAMALMPLFFPLPLCSAVSAVSVVIIGLQMVFLLRRSLQVKTVVIPVLFCMVTINLGLHLLDVYDEMVLRIILAGLLILVTLLFFVMRKKSIRLPDKWYSGAGAGLLAGMSTGLFNIVGPFMLIYYINVCKDTLHMKASLEFSFLLAGLYSMTMHIFVYGNINTFVLPQISASVIASLTAGFLGLKLYKKINKDRIALIVYILLPIMAAALVVRGLQ
jgi:uncharacterized membrane protein YfcA